MKNLIAFAFIAFGLIAADPAAAQQTASTDDSRDELLDKATRSGNVALQELVRSFTPITLIGWTKGRGEGGDGVVYVLGDIKTRIDWNAGDLLKVRIWNGQHVKVTPDQLQELKRRKEMLVALPGVTEGPAPTKQEIEADTREEDAYPPRLQLKQQTQIMYNRPDGGTVAGMLPAGSLVDSIKMRDGRCLVVELQSNMDGWIEAGNSDCGLARWSGTPPQQITSGATPQPATTAAQVSPPPVTPNGTKETESSQSTPNSGSLGMIGFLVLIVVGVGLVALNPRKKITALIFGLFGLPAWLWTSSWFDAKISNIKLFWTSPGVLRDIDTAINNPQNFGFLESVAARSDNMRLQKLLNGFTPISVRYNEKLAGTARVPGDLGNWISRTEMAASDREELTRRGQVILEALKNPIDPESAEGARIQLWEHYAWGFSIFWLLFFIVDLVRNRSRSKPRKPKKPSRKAPYWEAEKGIPHCSFERTSEGFRAAIFDSEGLGGAAGLLILTAFALGILYFFYGSTTALLVIFTLGAALAYFCAKRPPNRIEVTRDAVIIDKTHMKRGDFRNFNVFKKTRLIYDYGLRSYSLRGEWKTWEAEEIAAALNLHLMVAPSSASQPDPGDLRQARPTDF